jgi:hypothetical protein
VGRPVPAAQLESLLENFGDETEDVDELLALADACAKVREDALISLARELNVKPDVFLHADDDASDGEVAIVDDDDDQHDEQVGF